MGLFYLEEVEIMETKKENKEKVNKLPKYRYIAEDENGKLISSSTDKENILEDIKLFAIIRDRYNVKLYKSNYLI
jgi:hypothetical protein